MEAAAKTPPPASPYAHAAIPDPFRILGLRLQPFSLGHLLLLQRFDCAFLADTPTTATKADLILGVLVCSMRPVEFLDFLESPSFVREVATWGKKIKKFDFTAKAELFRQYLAAALQEPEYIAIQPGGEEGDWVQALKLTLTTRLGYSDAEAWEMPISKAFSEYYKLAEAEGLVRVLTPEDLAAGAANAAALAALNAQPRKQNGPATKS
jgi:hypothetical protein